MSVSVKERKKESFEIFNDIAGTYDFLNHFLSLGIDKYWRKMIRRNLPQKNQLQVLDLATGTADVPLELIKEKNIKNIIGMDLSTTMLAIGNRKIKKASLDDRIQLLVGDGVSVPVEQNSQDVITVSFGLRNFPDPKLSLKNMYRALKQDGQVMILEFSLPKWNWVKIFYLFYFRSVLPFIGNLISSHGDAYTYLNQSVEDFPYGKEMVSMIEAAGFSEVQEIPLSFGISTLYIGQKS